MSKRSHELLKKKQKKRCILHVSTKIEINSEETYNTLVYSNAIKIAINQKFKMRELSYQPNIL